MLQLSVKEEKQKRCQANLKGEEIPRGGEGPPLKKPGLWLPLLTSAREGGH